MISEEKSRVFLAAQDAVYDQVRAELSAGRKQSHWMWFIFPQLAGLGFSEMARKFALASLDEARGYLAHPILGQRLRECMGLILAGSERRIEKILGHPDDLKFRSCLTLFAQAAPDEPLFQTAIDAFYEGRQDPVTLDVLERGGIDPTQKSPGSL